MDRQAFITSLERQWATDHRWDGIRRPYGAGDVYRLRGSIDIEYSLARHGAARLWQLVQQDNHLAVLSAITGNQAIQEVQAGLNAIYVSGWQVAADANNALEMYPDQSLYPSDSVPALLRRINNALKRADEIAHLKGDDSISWFAPLVTDASWSSKCTPAAPPSIMFFMISKAWSGPPNPASASATSGANQEIESSPFRWAISSARLRALLMRRSSAGTESEGYRLWSGYISSALFASAATFQPLT